MEQVGIQVKLPLSTALRIAVQGIRIRLGRSMVTVSGVDLGIAFLMSNLTSQFVKSAVSLENESRQTVKLMESLIRAEIGTLEGRTVSIVKSGKFSVNDQALVTRILASQPKEVRAMGWAGAPAGVRSCSAADLGRDAAILLLLGDEVLLKDSLDVLTAGMKEKVVMDSVTNRRLTKWQSADIRREVFFGKEAEERAEKQKAANKDSRFRTIWITVISILVTVIGIANALLMSVTERFKEIGTMKCLGALSGFIRRMFLIESAIIGFAGAVAGTILGAGLTIVAYGFTFTFGILLPAINYASLAGAAAFCVVIGILLSMLAAIYPANFAARMVPASALRSNV